jgi:mono/diheme cytochrome c family protein
VRIQMLVFSLGAAISLAGVATAQEPGDPARGLTYASANCADCHGILKTETESPRQGVATFKRIAETPGMTATALAVWLQTPHPTMPNLIVPPSDRADLIAYILSLRDQRSQARPAH